ncbi:MAG: hypothetical protein JST68_31005 [Bacteroidetes bacterium]|nr:hypothetical protein [Bacteroidota bacterium]
MAFNLAGYRILFSCLERQAQEKMIERLDHKCYDRATLTEIKVPLRLPYILNDTDFERYDGSITLAGVNYNYVERKVANDTLILHCIPNKSANKIRSAYTEYGKHANGAQQNHTRLLLQSLSVAGFDQGHDFYPARLVFLVESPRYSRAGEIVVDDKFASSPEQPPDRA